MTAIPAVKEYLDQLLIKEVENSWKKKPRTKVIAKKEVTRDTAENAGDDILSRNSDPDSLVFIDNQEDQEEVKDTEGDISQSQITLKSAKGRKMNKGKDSNRQEIK